LSESLVPFISAKFISSEKAVCSIY